jgi:phosphoheptose isomerase
MSNRKEVPIDKSAVWSRQVASLAREDGLLAAIGAAGVNRAEVPDGLNLADHQDVR